MMNINKMGKTGNTINTTNPIGPANPSAPDITTPGTQPDVGPRPKRYIPDPDHQVDGGFHQ